MLRMILLCLLSQRFLAAVWSYLRQSLIGRLVMTRCAILYFTRDSISPVAFISVIFFLPPPRPGRAVERAPALRGGCRAGGSSSTLTDEEIVVCHEAEQEQHEM